MNKGEIIAAAKGLAGILPEVSVRFIGERDDTFLEPSGSRAGVAMRKRGRSIRAADENGEVAIAKGGSGALGEPDRTTASNQITRDDYTTAFTELGAIDPVYDPEMLTLIFEHSNSLRQNVDAFATNIDGFGHRFDPVIDLESSEVDEVIADAIYLDRLRLVEDPVNPDPKAADKVAYPTAEEVKAKKKEVHQKMRMEKSRLRYFFEYCSPDSSFVSLRRKTRQDLETTGNSYWEVLRNNAGQIVQFIYVPALTIRLLPLDPEPMIAKQKIRVSPLSFDEVEYSTRTRRLVQVVEGRAVMFKELGDTRVISSETGRIYPSIDALIQGEPLAKPATELIHFKVHSARSVYGVPRWIGNLLSVIGSRQAEEVNFNYFENKSVPPLAILISGGRMTAESVTRTQDYIETQIKGKRNFHKIMIIEAEGPSGTTGDNASKTKIDIKPLTGAQHNDALFQDYDERNIDKVGQAFRLPRMLRGDIRDFNRATADAALTFAEMQVFQPERQDFDFIMNRKILGALGIQFWEFVSLAPVMRDPEAMSNVVKNLMNANVLLPSEARELAGDVFNREFRKIHAPWASQPPAFTLAGINVADAEPGTGGAPASDHDPNFGREGGEDAPYRAPGAGIEANKREAIVAKALRRHAGKLILLRDAIEDVEMSAWRRDLLVEARAAASA